MLLNTLNLVPFWSVPYYSKLLFYSIVYFCFIAAGQAFATTEDSPPREVSINFYINSLKQIDNQNQSFAADFYVSYRWSDNSLAGKKADNIDWSKIWKPNIESINTDNFKRQYDDDILELVGPSRVQLIQRYKGQFTAQFKLIKFPFDKQVFPIALESNTNDVDSLALRYEFGENEEPPAKDQIYSYPIPPEKHIGESVRLSEWEIMGLRAVEEVNYYPFDGTSWSQFRIEIDMSRKFGFYLWNITLISSLTVLLSWSIFFLDPLKVSDRLRAEMTLFLSIVAFSLVASSMLPKIPYMTLLDYFMKLNYLMIILTAIESLYVYKLAEKGERELAKAKKIDRYALVAFPVVYISTTLVSWVAILLIE